MVWLSCRNAYYILPFNGGLELYLSTGSRHKPETNQSYFWHDLPGSSWLAVIIYNTFWLGKYCFHGHKCLYEITQFPHRICNRYSPVRDMVAKDLCHHAPAQPLIQVKETGPYFSRKTVLQAISQDGPPWSPCVVAQIPADTA